MREIKTHRTEDGLRYRVRYRLGGTETSETFVREGDAQTFRDLLGSGQNARVTEALTWLESKRAGTVEQMTMGQWFELWAGQLTGITKRTKSDYDALHRRYLTDLDHLPLTLVSRAHVAALVNRLEGEDYSPKTIKHAINLLSSVLSTAQDDGLIARNPVKRVRLPKVTRGDDQYLFLTHEEAGHLIGATAQHYQALTAFMFGTGLRWSEVTALQAKHIDLENGTVRVDRAWKRVPGGFELGQPKSQKSRRTVNAAVAALYAAHGLLKGRSPNDLVFVTPRGGIVRHSNFYNRVWVPACVAAKMTDPRPTPHDCRSTFGSWLLSEGIGLEAVQDQLGHESYETTRRIYAHLLPAVGVQAGKAASKGLDRALAAAEGVEFGSLSIEATGDPDEGAEPQHVETYLPHGGN